MHVNEPAYIIEVKSAVHDLAAAVEEKCSPEAIAGNVQNVLDKQGFAARRRSFEPGDVADGSPHRGKNHDAQVAQLARLQGRDRLTAIHAGDPRMVSDAFGIDVAAVREVQQRSDELLILSAYLQTQSADDLRAIARGTNYYADSYMPALQAAAMDTGTAGEGAEYVPLALSGSMIERVNLVLMVANLFPTIDMPTNPFDMPGFAITRTRSGKAAEQTESTGQTAIKKIIAASRKITLTAKKFAAEVVLSAELDEDSLIPTLPFLQEELIDYIAADVEDTILNGDTTGTHMDYDTTATDDPRKNWSGLRKLALAAAKTDAAAAALTAAMLRKNRSLMGKYGARSDQLAHIVSMGAYVALLADASVITVEKYGPQATILSGELGKVDGAPVILSEYVRNDLNATGVNDQTASNNTKTIALTVNRRGWLNGIRRSPTIQILRELYAEYDQLGIICSNRRAFQPRYPAATEPIVALHYNVAK